MAATRFYAFTRALNPQTGQPLVSAGIWTRGAPMAEVVVRILRTPQGTYKPERSFGVEYGQIDKGSADAPEALRSAIESALAKLVRDKLIENLTIEVERHGDRLLYEISFDDPKVAAGRRVGPLRGRV